MRGGDSLPPQVVDGELVAGLDQVGCHRVAHVAQADEPYSHVLALLAAIPGLVPGREAICPRRRNYTIGTLAQRGGLLSGPSCAITMKTP